MFCFRLWLVDSFDANCITGQYGNPEGTLQRIYTYCRKVNFISAMYILFPPSIFNFRKACFSPQRIFYFRIEYLSPQRIFNFRKDYSIYPCLKMIYLKCKSISHQVQASFSGRVGCPYETKIKMCILSRCFTKNPKYFLWNRNLICRENENIPCGN